MKHRRIPAVSRNWCEEKCQSENRRGAEEEPRIPSIIAIESVSVMGLVHSVMDFNPCMRIMPLSGSALSFSQKIRKRRRKSTKENNKDEPARTCGKTQPSVRFWDSCWPWGHPLLRSSSLF
jgi:hypothetical protein